MSSHEIVSREALRQISAISSDIKRQVGLLISRSGDVVYVIIGDDKRISIPDLAGYRSAGSRLNGLRCIHTHFHNEPISQEDLSDLVLLGLDMMVTVQVDPEGIPGPIDYAHILPKNIGVRGWDITRVPDSGQLDVDFKELIQAIEDELARTDRRPTLEKREKAVLAAVITGPSRYAKESLDELRALAISNDLADILIQHLKKPDPRFFIGKGKLSELVLRCTQAGANLLIFDNELTPNQIRSLTDYTELRIIDRSQLILDIFARRAVTREGKIQVELAQLKYLLPRLAEKNTAMSRLTGGIGARGPGETKLEINRRRARERIINLNRELEKIRQQRQDRRRLRNARRVPVVSIVGYTNAGKSTLLNTLTNSSIGAKDRLFETLDPSSRRLRFPREREVIITDTVGFIRALPRSLMDAFAATLEELHDADLLLHVVDAATPRMEEQIKTVDEILLQLDLKDIPCIIAFNKSDLIPPEAAAALSRMRDGVPISALDRSTLAPLLTRIENFLWRQGDR
jgi:GTP-binding protein HflX